jgi:glycerate dehydrogenase
VKAVFLDYATVSSGDLDTAGIRRVVPELELHDVTPEAEVAARIHDAGFVFTNKLRITREHLHGARELKLILLAATGTNNVDLDAARELGIGVCNIRDYCTTSVVQHVLGVTLLLTHHLREYSQLATGGAWAKSPQFTMLDHPIRELTGRHLGVVGYGTLGKAVARAAEAALGMKVLIANRPGGERQPGRLDLHDVLPQADVLTLHCPLTRDTQNMIGARELGLMKQDAILINTARGALVDVTALADALRSRRIAGAAIDVLPQEPPREGSPLFAPGIPNLIVTPHTAWAAREARQRALDEMTLNAEDFLRGGRRGRVV